uniref:sphingomyelin phosphodiesterase n=1 Tax=Otolemur garnettii TaxID=30611 RepID=H0XNE9_OTOGA
MLLVGLLLALPGLLHWLLLQAWHRPFCYHRPAPLCWVPPAPRRSPAEPVRCCLVFLSANLCLLPHGLASFNNLSHKTAAGRGHWCRAAGPPPALAVRLVAALPAGLDFVSLQEVFDLRAVVAWWTAWRRISPVLYDFGTLSLQPGLHLKLLGSGLLRAIFYCFPNTRREDALTCKGLLSAQAQLDNLDRCCMVGFLHAPPRRAPALALRAAVTVVDWAQQFEAESRQNDEVVASVLLSGLNFHNRSKYHSQKQQHKLFSCFPDPCRLGTLRRGDWTWGRPVAEALAYRALPRPPTGTRDAVEHLYLAAPPYGRSRTKPWRPGAWTIYITYGRVLGRLSPPVERVTFNTALAGLTDHLAIGPQLRVSMP